MYGFSLVVMYHLVSVIILHIIIFAPRKQLTTYLWIAKWFTAKQLATRKKVAGYHGFRWWFLLTAMQSQTYESFWSNVTLFTQVLSALSAISGPSLIISYVGNILQNKTPGT